MCSASECDREALIMRGHGPLKKNPAAHSHIIFRRKSTVDYEREFLLTDVCYCLFASITKTLSGKVAQILAIYDAVATKFYTVTP